jgi:hypothetical protein
VGDDDRGIGSKRGNGITIARAILSFGTFRSIAWQSFAVPARVTID